MSKKLICLIPIWNESWILGFTLNFNSKIFDHIIILDQLSKDNSIEIASKFNNVEVYSNNSEKFNEDERQLLLINYARSSYPHSILFALDADEVLFTYDIPSFKEHISNLRYGTNIFMPWLDIFPKSRNSLITKAKQFAYVDDGLAHKPLSMHSPRLPIGSINENLLNGAVIHFQYVNMNRNRSKHLWYIYHELAQGKSNSKIHLLSKYLHFIFRKKKPDNWVTKFFDSNTVELIELERKEDLIWKERLSKDFPNENKIISDVYDFFVFNKKIGFVPKIHAYATLIYFYLFKLYSKMKTLCK